MINEFKFCFECGCLGPLHNHHVIPRIMGGKSTVKLCEICHGKVHKLNFRDHGKLIRMGLEKTKNNGKKLGRPMGRMYKPKDFLKKHSDIVKCLKKGMSVRNTAKFTGKSGSTVQRVKEFL